MIGMGDNLNGCVTSVGIPYVAQTCLLQVCQHHFGGAQSPLWWEDNTMAGPKAGLVFTPAGSQ
jgi:hypothetical protein